MGYTLAYRVRPVPLDPDPSLLAVNETVRRSCLGPLQWRVPGLRITFPVLLSALAHLALGCVLLLTMLNIGLASNTALWPFICIWALAGYDILALLATLTVLAGDAPLRNRSPDSAALAQLALSDIVILGKAVISTSVIAVVALIWIVYVKPEVPLNPTADYLIYVSQQSLFAVTCAVSLYCGASALVSQIPTSGAMTYYIARGRSSRRQRSSELAPFIARTGPAGEGDDSDDDNEDEDGEDAYGEDADGGSGRSSDTSYRPKYAPAGTDSIFDEVVVSDASWMPRGASKKKRQSDKRQDR